VYLKNCMPAIDVNGGHRSFRGGAPGEYLAEGKRVGLVRLLKHRMRWGHLGKGASRGGTRWPGSNHVQLYIAGKKVSKPLH